MSKGLVFENVEALTAWECGPAPCDEPAKREDAIAAEGRSPAGAVDEASSEVEAPANNTMSMLTAHPGFDDAVSEIPTLKAEIERLQAERAEDHRRITSALARANDFRTALAESERKRVEAEYRLAEIISAGAVISAWQKETTHVEG